MAAEKSEKSLPGQAAELWDLVRAYAKQETLEPLKGIGRYAALGIAGSLLLSIGLVLLLLGGLRALQTQTGDTFDGQWSWAPYLIAIVGTGLVIALVLRGTRKKERP
jgi:formate-dependent nitrite reductase membrane component NrfD